MVEGIRNTEGMTNLEKFCNVVESAQYQPPQKRTCSIWWEQLGDEVQKAFPNGYTYGSGVPYDYKGNDDSTNVTVFLGDSVHQNTTKVADGIRNLGYFEPENRTTLGNVVEIPRAFVSEVAAMPFDVAAVAGRPDILCESVSNFDEIVAEGIEFTKHDPYSAGGAAAAVLVGGKGITKLKPSLKYTNAVKSCDGQLKKFFDYLDDIDDIKAPEPPPLICRTVVFSGVTTTYIMANASAAMILANNQYDAHKQIYPQPLLNLEELKKEGLSEKQCEIADNINKIAAFIYAHNKHPYTCLDLKSTENSGVELCMSAENKEKSKTVSFQENTPPEEISKKMAFVLSDPESPKMTNHNNGKIVNFENIYNSVDKQENIDKGIIQKTMLSLIKNQQYEALLKGIEAAPEEFHELQAQMSNEQLQAIVSILPSSNSKVPLEHFLKNNPRLEAAFYEHCFKVFGARYTLIDSLPAPEKDKQTREESAITAQTYEKMTGCNFKDDVEWELSFGQEDKVKMRCNLWQDYQ